MHGRNALAAVLVSAALFGCGQETGHAPARIEITDGPAAKPGQVRLSAPAATATRRETRRFRRSQLRVLRAHCATHPPDDPRCVDGRVDERVAFAALREGR